MRHSNVNCDPKYGWEPAWEGVRFSCGPNGTWQMKSRSRHVAPSRDAEAVRRNSSRQCHLKRMQKPNQVLRIERNHVRDGEKQRNGEKGAEPTRAPD
jgi:hypothetical protein